MIDELARIFGSFPGADQALLINQLPKSTRRALRMRWRNEAIVEAAGGFANQRAAARELAAELDRYSGGRYRFERGRPPPTDPRRAILHRILRLYDDIPPGAPTVRAVIAGVGERKGRARSSASALSGDC